MALQRVALFAEVPGRTLAAVAQRATEVEAAGGRRHRGGRRRGPPVRGRGGRLRVHQGEQTLTDARAGATVGELAALVPEPRSASVTALEPSLLLRIDKAVLDELLVDRPELASGIIAALVAMVRRGRCARARGLDAEREHRRPPRDAAGPLADRADPCCSGRWPRCSASWPTRCSSRPTARLAAGDVRRHRGRGRRRLGGDRAEARSASTWCGSRSSSWAAPRRPVRRSPGSIAPAAVAPGSPAPLLVLFPILIQLGFVFIGGPGGRILDIAGIKASFPRIMAGFPVGAVVGGLLAGPLVDLLGRTEDLLLATAIAQGAFAALVWATGRRYAAARARRVRASPADAAGGDRRGAEAALPSLRRCSAPASSPLILGYQVLSALGSQLSDFLVFDRAAAQFPDGRGPGAVPRGLHRGHEHREHRVPVPRRRPAASSVRPPARDRRQPARGHRVRRRDDRGARGDRRWLGRAARGGVGGPHRRHRPHRRHDPHLDQRDVPGPARPEPLCRHRRRSRAWACRSRSRVSGSSSSC